MSALRRNKDPDILVAPAHVLRVEVTEPLPSVVGAIAESGRPYCSALLLVLIHGRPLGRLEVTVPGTGLDAGALARLIWDNLHGAINSHLQGDGLPAATGLPVYSQATSDLPKCQTADHSAATGGPLASVVVATRERPLRLASCLPSMLSQHYSNYEVIVVDNAPSTTATADVVMGLAATDPRLRYVREDRPGLSWARNCGLAHARGEVVAFLDDDELPGPHWLSELAKEYSDPSVACANGLTIPAELETDAQVLIEQFGGFAKGRAFERAVFDLGPHRPAHPLFPYLSSHFGAGGNTSFRTSVIRRLGGFDPALGAGTPTGAAEEIEAYFRVIMAGHTLVYEPAALVGHFHRREVTDLRRVLGGYGTGFTAYLTRAVSDDPRRLLYLLLHLPHALVYLFSPGSARNRQKHRGYPVSLTLAELTGMARGPLAYWRSRRHVRRLIRQHGPLELGPVPQTHQRRDDDLDCALP